MLVAVIHSSSMLYRISGVWDDMLNGVTWPVQARNWGLGCMCSHAGSKTHAGVFWKGQCEQL